MLSNTKSMQDQIEACISRKRVIHRLEIKEHIQSGPLGAFSAHPLETASISARTLYRLKRTFCTYDQLLSSSIRHASIISLRDGGTTSGSSSPEPDLISSMSPTSACTIPMILRSPPPDESRYSPFSCFSFGSNSLSSVNGWPVMRLRSLSNQI